MCQRNKCKNFTLCGCILYGMKFIYTRFEHISGVERNFYGYQFLAESRFVNVNLDQITAVR